MRHVRDLLWCLLFGHDPYPILEQARDECGRVRRPHTLNWICQRCHRLIGQTTTTTRAI